MPRFCEYTTGTTDTASTHSATMRRRIDANSSQPMRNQTSSIE